jgi:hypothetical protein
MWFKNNLSYFIIKSFFILFNSPLFDLKDIVVAVNRHVEINTISKKILLILNIANFDGKYRVIDNERANARAPPLMILFRMDSETF